jgi:uncharacterized repeat protein (TIGR01451 family)
MHKNAIFPILIISCFFIPFSAMAEPQVEIKTVSEKEILEKVNGREITKIVPATEIEPGQNMIFRLKYANTGDEKATNVVINNPIPKDTAYLVGSAFGKNSKITFSIDSGQTFKKPSLLKYEVQGPNGKLVTKLASPENYTDIRWIIKEIIPGAQGEVGFKIKVK